MTSPELLAVALGSGSPAQLVKALNGIARTASDRPEFVEGVRRALDQHLTALVREATKPDAPSDLKDALELVLVIIRPMGGAIAALDDAPPLTPPFLTLATQILLTAAAGLEEEAKAEPDAPPALLAWTHLQLSYAFRRQGENEWSVMAARRATAVYRELVGHHGSEHLSGLTSALDSLSVNLSRQGDVDGAYAASTEAVQLLRTLAEDRDPITLSRLAHCLINHSVDLGAVDQPDEALATMEEATALVRALASDDDQEYAAQLGWALHNLAVQLGAAGRDGEALDAIEEAVRLRRRLVAHDPDKHLPELASSLNSRSTRLTAVGRRLEALSASEEACAIFRALTQIRVDSVGDNDDSLYLPELAMALNNLSVDRASVGRRAADALSASSEAVTIRRGLARRNPQKFSEHLATSLHNLSVDLDAVGDNEAALAAIEEAVAIKRSLVAVRPQAHTIDLARSLRSMSVRLSVAGRPSEAVRYAQEAVDLMRATASTSSAQVELARALGNLATRLGAVDRHDEAVAAAREAVDLRRELVKRSGAGHLADLATALNNLAALLSGLDQMGDAVVAGEEAVGVRRQLVAMTPARYLPDLASSLSNLSVDLCALKQYARARAAAEEAVHICRELVGIDVPSSVSDLAMSVGNLADTLYATDSGDKAERLFSDLLAEYQDHPWAVGVVVLERAWCKVSSDDVAAVITDGLRALELLPDDSPRYFSARRLLRGMRTKDPATFDRLWAGRGRLPAWLSHTEPAQAMVDLVNAWMDCAATGDHEAAKAFLEAHPELQSEEAESAMDRLIDANRGHAGLRSHREIITNARTIGAAAAYDKHVERLWRDAVELAVRKWIGALDAQELKARLADDEPLLLSDEALSHGEELLIRHSRTPDLLWRIGLLTLCRSDGGAAGFGLLDDEVQLRRRPGRRALTAFEPRMLGLARVRAGREPDDAEAHYIHAVVAFIAGHDDEAFEAMWRCADLSTTWERPERARQLAGLTSVRPDLAEGLLQLRKVLITRRIG